MIDALNLVVAASTLILQRKDRRSDAVDSEAAVQQALERFYRFARTWAKLAEELRHGLHHWRRHGSPEHDYGVIPGAVRKRAHVLRFERHLDEVFYTLDLHAPGLLADLEALARRADQNLERMAEEVLARRDEGAQALDTYIEEFDRRTDEVIASVEELRVLLRDAYPLGTEGRRR